MKTKLSLTLLALLLSGCGNTSTEKPKDDFTIHATGGDDINKAIPLFKTLVSHCPGIYKYKEDVERVEYAGGTGIEVTIKQRPTVMPLDSYPMGHTCHFQVSDSKATVGKRPCAWLCTGNNMEGIDGEDHSYANGNLIGPLKREWANLREAVAGTRLDMADIDGADLSKGAALLALWGADRMKWNELQDVSAGKYGLVMKDSDSQRGRRICTSGQIIEIALDKSVPDKKIFMGGMYDEDERIYRFISVRSTGELVANSYARFCGIITGQQHYQNSLGGTAHAVHLVGMFDLPENRKPQ